MPLDSSAIRNLAGNLSNAGRETRVRAGIVVRKTAIDIQRDAKILAPYEFGNLRNSIGVSFGNLSAEIGPTANYGVFQEMGTSRMAAQPFMGPATDRHEGPFEQAMSLLAEEALRG